MVNQKSGGGVLSTLLALVAVTCIVSTVAHNVTIINEQSKESQESTSEKSSQKDEFLRIMEEEIGKSDGTKYTGGKKVDWCLWLIVWCKNKVGISSEIIPDYGYCGDLVNFYKDKNRWYKRGEKTPEKGWIAVFNWENDSDPYDHAGVISKVYKDGDKTKIEVINVNWGSKVAKASFDINDQRILGYASPDYNKDLVLNQKKDEKVLGFKYEKDDIVLDFENNKFKYKYEEREL